jgi:putative transposase
MNADLKTRSFRYALRPFAVQARAIDQAASAARRYWNNLVATQRWAEHEIRHGRRGSVVNAYRDTLLGKKLTGCACGADARERAAEKGIPLNQAVRELRAEAAQKQGEMSLRAKDGKPLRAMSRRKLAVAYAVEGVDATRKAKGSPVSSQVAFSLIAKFQDSCKLYITGKRGRPKFKGKEDSVSLQCQITATTPYPLSHDRGKTCVDLARLAGVTCAKVPVIFHRPLAPDAKVKRVAVTVRNGRYYVSFQVDAPAGAFARAIPAAEGQVLGIDPGRKIALAVASPDGTFSEAVQPPVGRDRRFLKRLRRAQRQLARRRRLANPDCFDEKGRCKRGHRPRVKTRSMARTEARLAEMARHLTDARTDFYHRTAIELLQQADLIGVGTWRGKAHAPGEGKAKRAQVRKDADHAISGFVSILKDKASLSARPKRVIDIKEPGTTCQCPDCGARSGPSGLEGLNIREWTCTNCGTFHQRDFAAARSIGRRAAAEAAAGAQAGVAVAAKPKVKRGRSPEGEQTKGPPQGGQVPVAHEAVPARAASRRRPPSAAGAAGAGQAQRPVTGVVGNGLPRGHVRPAAERRKPPGAGTAEGASG